MIRSPPKKAAKQSDAAGTTERARTWPEHVLHDTTLEAFMRRVEAHKRSIIDRGGFSGELAMRALVRPDKRDKGPVARWLRAELTALSDGERVVGSAPVFSGQTMSRLEIADLAMTLIEPLSDDIGDDLIVLLQELLHVDRHRRSLAGKPSEQFQMTAQLEAQFALRGGRFGVRELAEIVSTSPASITSWRKSPDYQQAVESARKMWDELLRRDYFPEIKAEYPDISDTQAFSRAFRMYEERVPSWPPDGSASV